MTRTERVNAHLAAHRHWCAERDASRRQSQRLSLNPDDPHQAARPEHIDAYLAALRDRRGDEPSTGPESDRQPVIDGRPLPEQMGLQINFADADPDVFARFVDALTEVLEGMPEIDRNLLFIRWRNSRPTATLADQLDGRRSHHDPHTGRFHFAWDVLGCLAPQLLRAALAHELAHAILTARGERPTEDTAMRLATSWGHRPFPR
jgi:hypothetical protein